MHALQTVLVFEMSSDSNPGLFRNQKQGLAAFKKKTGRSEGLGGIKPPMASPKPKTTLDTKI